MTTKLLLVLIALGVWMIALDPWLHPIAVAAQGPGLRSWRSHPAECASCYFLTPVFALRSVVISTPSESASHFWLQFPREYTFVHFFHD